MTLLHRARAAAQTRSSLQAQQPTEQTARAHLRMPHRFIGMAGVYDISKHFTYESLRGVQASLVTQ